MGQMVIVETVSAKMSSLEEDWQINGRHRPAIVCVFSVLLQIPVNIRGFEDIQVVANELSRVF